MKEGSLIDWIVNWQGWNYWADSPQSNNHIKHNSESTENDEKDENYESNNNGDGDDDDERCSCAETSLPEGGSRAGLKGGEWPTAQTFFSLFLCKSDEDFLLSTDL